MKVTITYKRCQQIGPDTWDEGIEVIHLKEKDTVSEIYEKHFKRKWLGKVDVELHIDPSDE